MILAPREPPRPAGKDGNDVQLAVITPSYRRDYELCRDLHQSVLRHTPDDVVHHLVVPRRDARLFRSLDGPRARIWFVEELVPDHMLPVPRVNVWLNIRRPYPPVRGWIMQQVVKFALAARVDADVLLLADSDTCLIRPVTTASFVTESGVVFYRLADAVHAAMPRHVSWHRRARELLGIEAAEPPLPDYVSTINVWERRTVLELLERVERATGKRWADALSAQVHFSEFILYGTFVEEVVGLADVAVTHDLGCLTYWDEEPLDEVALMRFLSQVTERTIAVSISAKSGTPLRARREALASLPGATSD
jgi:hypothetical protein